MGDLASRNRAPAPERVSPCLTWRRQVRQQKAREKWAFVSPVPPVSPSMNFIMKAVDIERQGNNSPPRPLCWDRWDKRSIHAGFKVGLQARYTPATGETVGLSAAINKDKVKRCDGPTLKPCHLAARGSLHGFMPGTAGTSLKLRRGCDALPIRL